jgi:hypothetical protein
MLRRRQTVGLALLLAAGLCLPTRESAAQGAAPKVVPATATTNTAQAKGRAHRKKAAPDPPAPQAPAPPPTLEQSPPVAAQVNYSNSQLSINAPNSTLSQVLRSVQSLTGAAVELAPGASSERVVGQFGPGAPRDVLNALLNGSKFNYIILGVDGNPGAVQRVILTTAKPASPVNTAQNNNAPPPPPEEPQDEDEPEPQPGPPQPIPPQFRHRPNMPGRPPEAFNPPQPQMPVEVSPENPQLPAPKTPEQLLQELQQMQQQQQQMQDQLNPANRQAPQ